MMLDITVQENSFKGAGVLSRLGVHYFPDGEHYHLADTLTWLPKLQAMGAHWVILQANAERAIPEDFIRSLTATGIQPILHFQLALTDDTSAETLQGLFDAYAKWGVRYVVLFDKPNLRSQWPASGWTQRGLVPRFMELFTPLAKAAIEAGLTPVFPPLEPGGDYWDTAFLRGALETLDQAGEEVLLDHLALGAYAWLGDKALTWGEGGPERWPATLPYSTPENSQDQRGFRIFDWYNAVSLAAIGRSLPTILVATGCAATGAGDTARMQELLVTLKQAELPSNLLAAGLWLLAAQDEHPAAGQAWFSAEGTPRPLAEQLLEPGRLAAHSFARPADPADSQEDLQGAARAHSLPEAAVWPPSELAPSSNGKAIRHYLLLPDAHWPLQTAASFVAAHQPTIGYVLAEALLAQRVTLAGGLEAFADSTLRELIQAGCQVDHLANASQE